MGVTAYTDGSCRPCKNGTGSAAFLVIDGAGAILAQEAVVAFPAANVTVAEIAAILAAMRWLLDNGHHGARIRTDSNAIILALENGASFDSATRPWWDLLTQWAEHFHSIDFEFAPRTTPEIRVCDHACRMARTMARAAQAGAGESAWA